MIQSETQEGTGKIVIVDKDRPWAEALQTILRGRGYAIDIETNDLQNCYEKAREGEYVAAVVNVHSLSNYKKELTEFNHSFPVVLVLLIMEHEDPEAETLHWQPNAVAHQFLGKKEDRLYAQFAEAIDNLIRFYGIIPDFNIILPENIDSIFSSYAQSRTGVTRMKPELSLKAMKQELLVVISRLFSNRSDQNNQPIVKEIKVDAFGEDAGKSGSLMFKITPKIVLDDKMRKSAVLKFGPKEETHRESLNYDKFVEWFLTYDQTVRKIKYAEGNKFGGILYSYPRDVVGGYESFADYMRGEDESKCTSMIGKMFNVDNQHWLSVDGNSFVDRETAIFQTYYIDHVLHASLHEMRSTHLKKLADEINNLERRLGRKLEKRIWEYRDDSITFPYLDISIPNPVSFLNDPSLVEGIKLTVIHGDLHAHNIIVTATEKDERYFFIDFYYTGFGDIYRDFIELELSVRYDLFCSSSLPAQKRLTAPDCNSTAADGLKKLIRLENALINGTVYGKESMDPLLNENKDIHKAFRIISEIRRFAFENCADKKKVYYMGLIVSALKALKYFYPLDVKIHRLVVAGLYLRLLKEGKIS